jgi:predicted metal-dependent HD superfamily phosphohydrolase
MRMDHVTDENLLNRWMALAPASTAEPDRWASLGRDLLARYDGGFRFYHDSRHLAHVLDVVDDLAEEADDLDAVRLAAWFHDAVYDAQSADNEEQSAQLAEAELTAAGVAANRVSDVARLVRLTATHAVEPGDRDGAVLCDADLAILASPVDVYNEYSSDVRVEYAHVPDTEFRTGRAAVLRRLLALPRLFATERGHARWEARARSNVEGEIADLESWDGRL